MLRFQTIYDNHLVSWGVPPVNVPALGVQLEYELTIAVLDVVLASGFVPERAVAGFAGDRCRALARLWMSGWPLASRSPLPRSVLPCRLVFTHS